MTSISSESKRKRKSCEEETKTEKIQTAEEEKEPKTVYAVIQNHPLSGIKLIGLFADSTDAADVAYKAMRVPLKGGRQLNVSVSILNSLVTPKQDGNKTKD